MDLYSGPEIADGARRTVSALRKFQLTQAVGDPSKGIAPNLLEIPPVVVDMDAGYGNIFNVQRQTELLVTAGVAAAHLEDQVLPKRCGHIGGKALVPAQEMVGKLRMMRAVADDLGREDFTIIARTDGLSAIDAPEPARGRGWRSSEPVATSTRASPTSCGASSRRRTASPSRPSPPRFGSASRRRGSRSTGRRPSSGSSTPTRSRSRSSAISASSSSSSPRRPARGRSRPLHAPVRDGRAPGAGLHRAAAPRVRGRVRLPTRSHHEFSGVPWHRSWARPTTRRGWVASSPRTCPRTRSSSARPTHPIDACGASPSRPSSPSSCAPACWPSSQSRSRSFPSASSCPRASAAARLPELALLLGPGWHVPPRVALTVHRRASHRHCRVPWRGERPSTRRSSRCSPSPPMACPRARAGSTSRSGTLPGAGLPGRR